MCDDVFQAVVELGEVELVDECWGDEEGDDGTDVEDEEHTVES